MASTRSLGNQNRRIAGTARAYQYGNFATGDIANGGDEFMD